MNHFNTRVKKSEPGLRKQLKINVKLASEMPVPHSLGKYSEIVFNTMRYRGETVQRSGYFQSSVSYIKVKMMFK